MKNQAEWARVSHTTSSSDMTEKSSQMDGTTDLTPSLTPHPFRISAMRNFEKLGASGRSAIYP